MAFKRVSACSSDCLVSFNSGEGTRQECALTDGPRKRGRKMRPGLQIALDFLSFNDFFWPSVAWHKYRRSFHVGSKWESADLNLFSIRVSSGCFPRAVTGWWRHGSPDWCTSFCVWFDFMGAVHVKWHKPTCSPWSPFSLSLFKAGNKPRQDHNQLSLTPTYAGHNCTANIHANNLIQTYSYI